jgi:hypothetical protein
VGVLEQLLAERALDRLATWQQQRKGEDAVWRDSAGIDNTGIYLGAEELAELVAQIRQLVQRYVDERPIDDKSARPAGSRHVQITQIVTVSPPAPDDEDQDQDEPEAGR